MAVYEGLSKNLTQVDNQLLNNIIQLNILTLEKEQIIRRGQFDGEDANWRQELETNRIIMELVNDRLPTIRAMMGRDFVCGYRTLYEGIIMNVKSVVLGVQQRRARDEKLVRDRLVMREDYIKRIFGEQSQQWHDVRDEILRHDDVRLKERAVKFKDFLDRNNEKATKAFCRLSKEGGGGM
jgi:hypothetical protein